LVLSVLVAYSAAKPFGNENTPVSDEDDCPGYLTCIKDAPAANTACLSGMAALLKAEPTTDPACVLTVNGTTYDSRVVEWKELEYMTACYGGTDCPKDLGTGDYARPPDGTPPATLTPNAVFDLCNKADAIVALCNTHYWCYSKSTKCNACLADSQIPKWDAKIDADRDAAAKTAPCDKTKLYDYFNYMGTQDVAE